MEMNPETIKALLDAFDSSDWQEMTITMGADRLHVSRDPSANGALPAPAPPAADAAPAQLPPAPPSAPAAAAPPAAAPATAAPVDAAPVDAAPVDAAPVDAVGTVVASPSVGLFWRAPSPSSPPFVEVGARVSAGDTVGIVEVMKLMNHVVAPVAGTVTAIHVANGDMVEFGQPLVVVDAEA
jgi:acetyl-CoA carboxylase biotin carboxyl carrier protein